MREKYSKISEILLNCEENGNAPKFIVQEETYKKQKVSLFKQTLPVQTKPVIFNSNGEEIFVVSDLHIASGRNNAGIYFGTENFFADDSFYRFLEYADDIKKTGKAILIINGDIFDFLRVTEYPGKVKKVRPVKRLKHLLKFDPLEKPSEPDQEIINDEYDEWIEELEKIGIIKTREELEKSISEKEKILGLRTDDYKTIYKLIKIKNGHKKFFDALSYWVQKENKLIIVKGNHDIELHWRAVRNYLRLIIAEGIGKNTGKNLEDILERNVLPEITFIDDAVEIDKDFYVEHGHRYDKYTLILDSPVLRHNPKQINIPFGSFFNRYLLNRVELFYPFLDNVRPTLNVLPFLIKENFPLAVKVLFQHVPLVLRIISTNLRYTWFMFNRVFWFLAALLLPFIILYLINPGFFTGLFDLSSKITNGVPAFILNIISNLGTLILSYFLSRLVAWFQLTEPSSLNKYGKMIFDKNSYRIIIMGHTHNPGEYLYENKKRFYNTGTWIPVVETSTAEIREDKTYTFLHLVRDEEGNLQPSNNGLLLRWNDDAERAEPQIIIGRK